MASYDYQIFDYVKPAGLSAAEPRHKVIIIGAGPIGLALAIDLAMRNIPCLVLDDNNVVSVGSRAICWAKRTLEIFDRLGIGTKMLEKGVVWQTGRLFHHDREVYHFDLLPEQGHKYPAFINLQQYYVEEYLIERAGDFPDLIDLRFKNKVTNHHDHGDYVTLDITTPDGTYQLESDYIIACDGANSPTRQRMGLSFEGQSFNEKFLIADIETDQTPFETQTPERWFWFQPPFHNGQSALLHQQPDNIYRIDLQLGPDADTDKENDPEQVIPRIQAILGDKPFTLDWMSIYQFRCASMEEFVHGRVIFAGDSAHVVSPFGARGGNGGIHDIDNLCWKLAALIDGTAAPSILASYDEERGHGAAENIANSARATNFMTPKSPVEMLFRNEVLKLASTMPFARKLINSGRLSLPCSLAGLSLQTDGPCQAMVGTAVKDVPLQDNQWLISLLPAGFTLLAIGDLKAPYCEGIARIGLNQSDDDYPCYHGDVDFIAERYGRDALYLIRPDGHIAASFETADKAAIMAAFDKARGY
ncbi:MAG: FAD-dependent oxidoreductase [Candidatus Puniceispirillaceae bacterium]